MVVRMCQSISTEVLGHNHSRKPLGSAAGSARVCSSAKDGMLLRLEPISVGRTAIGGRDASSARRDDRAYWTKSVREEQHRDAKEIGRPTTGALLG
jgi:hypothetical protein